MEKAPTASEGVAPAANGRPLTNPETFSDDETRRLAVLRSYAWAGAADTSSAEGFDALTKLATRLFAVPIALISFVDAEFAWFKSSVGLGEISRIVRAESYFCDATLKSRELCFVPDASRDPRFAKSPFVQGQNPVRFFAGVPLAVPEGARVGTFCVADTKLREFSEADRELLLELAALASREVVRQRRENLFRALVENGSELLLVLSEGGALVYASRSFERTLGYASSELLGQAVFPLVHPDDRAVAVARFRALLAGQSRDEALTLRAQHRDGTFRWLECRGLNRLGEHTIGGIVVNARDVTEQVHAYSKLEESRNRFQVAFEESSLGIALVAPSGQWLRANRAVCDFLGYTEEELQNTDFQSVTHPDDLDADVGLVQAALRGESPRFSMEKRYITARGETVWGEINVTLARDAAGAPLYFVSQVQDITARRAQEERLRLLESVAIHASDAILITDADLENGPEIIYANRAFYEMTLFDEADILGKTPRVLQGPHTCPQTRALMRQCLAQGRAHTVEILNYKKDGTPFWVEISLAPILDGGKKLTHWVAFQRDVSRRKTDQTLLQNALKTAEDANRAKSEFLSRMSHEFRTPLNAILGFAQLLETAPLHEKDRQSVGFIRHAGEHLLELVDEILDIARIESGHLTVEITPVSLREMAVELLEWVRPLAQKRGLEIVACHDASSFCLADAAPFNSPEFTSSCDILEAQLVVLADARRLRQILLNLLSNAVKFNRNGGALSLCSHTVTRDGARRALIGVRDSGYGIAPEQLQNLWVPFERLGAEQSGIEGTGIGLALSKNLALLMGGDLRCESQLGCGSIFWLELPMAPENLTFSTQ